MMFSWHYSAFVDRKKTIKGSGSPQKYVVVNQFKEVKIDNKHGLSIVVAFDPFSPVLTVDLRGANSTNHIKPDRVTTSLNPGITTNHPLSKGCSTWVTLSGTRGCAL
jgi:hypothetical protein